MLRTMAAAYEIGQLRGNPLHPANLLLLRTTLPPVVFLMVTGSHGFLKERVYLLLCLWTGGW